MVTVKTKADREVRPAIGAQASGANLPVCLAFPEDLRAAPEIELAVTRPHAAPSISISNPS